MRPLLVLRFSTTIFVSATLLFACQPVVARMILPVLGGGAQWKLAGERLDLGLEALLSFSSRSNLQAFSSSGGTTTVAFDVDLLLVELYGGPFVSKFIGRV